MDEQQKMKLYQQFLSRNDCYRAGRTITPRGVMVHSTGANNPNLCRYVGPDDGLLGENRYGNHWNQEKPGGSYVCCHAFIGKLADGTIATYQTLPWDYRGWHAGGSANNTHIGFEICEDDLTDKVYFQKVYREAVELCAYLCKQYDLTEQDIICHSEGYKKGIASNHGDVMHWFPKHSKSMDAFRAEVKAELDRLEKSLADNTAASWSADAVNWAVSSGLMAGDANGNLMLRSPLTREQFCVMLKRYHDQFHTA